MFPLLLKIGPVPLYSYGFFVALGFLSAVLIVSRLAIRDRLDVERILDLVFWVLLIGFIGARTLFVLTQWRAFAEDPGAIVRIWEGGFVFYGGLLLAGPFAWIYLRHYQVPAGPVFDILAPSLAVAHALGRIGCLAAGCCYGFPTSLPWAVELRGVMTHPVQIYESLLLFGLFSVLMLRRRSKRYDGEIALLYLAGYAAIRIGTEFFRGDDIRGFYWGGFLSTSQAISAALLLGLLVVLRFLEGKKRVAVILLGLLWGVHSDSARASHEVIDATQSRVQIVDSPQRIVTLAPSLGELAADLLGAEIHRIVGVSEYTDTPSALERVTSVGSYNHFNLEKVVTLKPDLVLATRDGNPREQVLRLRELGISVVVVDTGDFAQVIQSIRWVGAALGKSLAAEKRVSEFEAGLRALRARRRLREGQHPKVVLQLGDDPLVVVGSGTFLGAALEELGATHVYSDSIAHYPKPSLEDVLKKNPDVILVLALGRDRSTFDKMATRWKRFSKLTAVEYDKVRVVQADGLLRPSARLIDGMIQLERLIYGDR